MSKRIIENRFKDWLIGGGVGILLSLILGSLWLFSSSERLDTLWKSDEKILVAEKVIFEKVFNCKNVTEPGMFPIQVETEFVCPFSDFNFTKNYAWCFDPNGSVYFGHSYHKIDKDKKLIWYNITSWVPGDNIYEVCKDSTVGIFSTISREINKSYNCDFEKFGTCYLNNETNCIDCESKRDSNRNGKCDGLEEFCTHICITSNDINITTTGGSNALKKMNENVECILQ